MKYRAMDRWCCSAEEKLAFGNTTLGNREEQVQLRKVLEEQAMQRHQRHKLTLPQAAIPKMVSSQQQQNVQSHLQRQRQELKLQSYQQQQDTQNSILLHPPTLYESWGNRLVLEQQNDSSSTGLALSYLGPKEQQQALDQVHAQQRPEISILGKKPRFRSSKATITSSYIDASTMNSRSMSPSTRSGSFGSTMTTVVDGQGEHRLYNRLLAPQYLIGQQEQQRNRQGSQINLGKLRYRECMDYAHLGCRHFVPCNDVDDLDPAMSRCANNSAAHQVGGATRMIKVKVALPAAVNYSSCSSPQQQAQDSQHKQQAQMAGRRGIIGLHKLEAGRFFVGHFQDPARVKRPLVRKGIEDSSGGTAMDDEGKKEVIEIDKLQQGCCSSSEMAVSQVTCVESGESGNGPEEQQEQEGKRIDEGADLGTWSLASAEMGMGARLKAKQEEQGGDCGIEREAMEQDETQGDEYSLAADALDVLADAAIQVSGSTAGDCSLDCEGEFQSDEDTLGIMKRRKEARFVHGEIPFVQKRVRRCAKPISKVGGHQGGDQSCSSPDLDSQPVRVSQRRIVHSKRLLQDEYEYEMLPAVKKSRIEKKKVAAAKPCGKKSDRKIGTPAKNKIKDVDLTHSNGEQVKQARKKCAGGQKKRNLSSVVKRSEVNQRGLVKVEENGAGNGIKLETAANGGDHQEQLINSSMFQDADHEAHGAVVRSKRGRNQNLPVRFQGSVLGTWKKGDRKKAKA